MSNYGPDQGAPGAPYPSYPPPPPPPYQTPPQPEKLSGLAVASLVLGITWVCWLGSILALIFGYMALSRIRTSHERGRGLAIAGIVLGWIGAVVLVISIAVAAAGSEDPDETSTGDETTEAPETTETTAAPETTERETTTTAPPTTTTTAPPTTTTTENPEVSNARAQARSYLDLMGFSRTGLIEQLEFEGYPNEAATTAVDGLNADWFAEAAESARAYNETMPFSRSGLVEQLVFEGFTQEEAEHGAAAALG